MNLFKYIKNKCYPTWPKSASMEDWAKWHKYAKKRKMCYWLSHDLPAKVRYRTSRIKDIKHWFNYRFVKRHKYQLIDTKLEPNYYEIETRMLHGMFSLLVDFVEREKAQLHYIGMEGGDVKPSPRNAGLAHLDWEISLTWGEDEAYHKPELIGKRTPQAISAEKVKDLFLWWTEVRPARKDPWDDDFFNKEIIGDSYADLLESLTNKTEAEKQSSRDSFRRRETITDAYTAEDTKMLHRLIDIRFTMWS